MPKLYTAVAGDTLESVAALYGSNELLIAAASGLTDPDEQIQPGQILTIP